MHRLRPTARASRASSTIAPGARAQRLDCAARAGGRRLARRAPRRLRACRSVAAAYEADRLALRGLRDQQPEPPRDLWARTAAAIERESAVARRPRADGARRDRRATRARRPVGRRGHRRRHRRDASCPAGSCNGTVDARSSRRRRSRRSPSCRLADDARCRRPIAVGAGSVGWVGTSAERRARLQRHQGRRGLSGRAPAGLRARQRTRLQAGRHLRSGRSRSRSRRSATRRSSSGPTRRATTRSLVIALPTAATRRADADRRRATPTVDAERRRPDRDRHRRAAPSVDPSPASTAVRAALRRRRCDAERRPPSPPVEPTPSPHPSATAGQPRRRPRPRRSPADARDRVRRQGRRRVGGVFPGRRAGSPSPPVRPTARPVRTSTSGGSATTRAQKLTHDQPASSPRGSSDRLIGSRPVGTQATDADAVGRVVLPRSRDRRRDRRSTGGAWRPVVDPDGHWAVTWDGTVELGRTTACRSLRPRARSSSAPSPPRRRSRRRRPMPAR